MAAVAGSGVDGSEVGVEGGLGPFVGCLVTGGVAALEGGGLFFGFFPAVLTNEPGMVHESELSLQLVI